MIGKKPGLRVYRATIEVQSVIVRTLADYVRFFPGFSPFATFPARVIFGSERPREILLKHCFTSATRLEPDRAFLFPFVH